jgi:predicted nuclease with TOPRIM domain
MIVTDFLRLFPQFTKLEDENARFWGEYNDSLPGLDANVRNLDRAKGEIEALTSELVSNEEELSTVRTALDEERRRNSQLQDTVYRLQAQSDQASTRADEAVRNEVLAYKAIINMETQRTRGTIMFPEASHLPKSLVDSPDPIQAPYVHGSQLVTTAKKKFRKQVEEVLTAKS